MIRVGNSHRGTDGRKLRVILLTTAVLATLLLAAGAGTAGAELTINSCTTIDTNNAPNDGLVLLNQSIQDSSAPSCVNITTSNIVFDGQGNTVEGVEDPNTDGIEVTNTSTTISNVTVRNVTVTDWDFSVGYNNVDGGEITDTNLTALPSVSGAVSIIGSTGVDVRDNRINDAGAGINPASDSVVVNNTISSSVNTGLSIVGSSDNVTFRENDIFSATGANSNGATNIRLVSNNFTSNAQNAIRMTSVSSGIVLENNNITSPGNNGILLDSSSGVSVIDNNISNAGANGMVIDDATNVTLENNNITTVGASNADAVRLLGSSSEITVTGGSIDLSASGRNGVQGFGSGYTSVTGLTVKNVDIEGATLGVRVQNGGDSTIRGNNITNSGSNGIFLTGSPNSAIENNLVETAGTGFTGTEGIIFGGDSVVVSGNVVEEVQSADAGISATFGASNAVISDNTVNDIQGGDGILVEGDDSLVNNNTVTNAGTYGIRLISVSNNLVSDNNVTGSDFQGILLVSPGTGGNEIVDNQVGPNNRQGIELANVDPGNTVSGNNVSANDGKGIIIGRTEESDVLGNNVSAHSESGIFVDSDSNRTVVDGNTVTDNNQGSSFGAAGIFVNNSADAEITQNRVHRNSIFGVFVGEANGTVIRGNAVTDNCGGTAGIQLAGTSNDVLIESNNVSANTGTGVDVGFSNPFDGSNLTIRDVRANDNGQSGISVQGTQSPTLRDIEANNNTNAGVGVNSSSSTLDNITALRNGDFGVVVGTSGNDTMVENSDVRENSDSILPNIGIRVDALDVAVRNTTTTDNGLDLSARDENTTLENVNLGSATVSGTANEVDINETVSPPADPSNAQNIGQYFNATNRTSSSFFDATVEYDQSDVTNAGVDESSLILAAFDSTWSPVSGSTVDTNANTVSANITSFSVFAPLADEGFTGTPGLGGGECVDRRDISRGQEEQECPRDRGLSRGESRDDLDRSTGRNSDTSRRDRGRRNRGRSR